MTEKLFHTHLTEPMEKQTDIEKIKAGKGIFNLNGTLVTQLVGGWSVFGVTCSTPEEVLDAIQNACSILSESIIRPNSFTVDAKTGSNIAVNASEVVNFQDNPEKV
jgi:hypothetical protein